MNGDSSRILIELSLVKSKSQKNEKNNNNNFSSTNDFWLRFSL